MIEVNWKGFPKPCATFEVAKKNALELQKDSQLVYDLYPIPKGLMIGVVYNLLKDSFCIIDVSGNYINLYLGVVAINSIKESIKPYKDEILLEKRKEAGSKVTFWYGLCDTACGKNYMMLTLVVSDGKIESFSKWENCKLPEKNIFNIQDLDKNVVSLVAPIDSIVNAIKETLVGDRITKVVGGSNDKNVSRVSYVLCLPQSKFLRQRPHTWVLYKKKTKNV